MSSDEVRFDVIVLGKKLGTAAGVHDLAHFTAWYDQFEPDNGVDVFEGCEDEKELTLIVCYEDGTLELRSVEGFDYESRMLVSIEKILWGVL